MLIKLTIFIKIYLHFSFSNYKGAKQILTPNPLTLVIIYKHTFKFCRFIWNLQLLNELLTFVNKRKTCNDL